MNIELIAYTPHPEKVCAFAMLNCHTQNIRGVQSGEKERLIKLAIKLGHESVLEHASFTFLATGLSRVCTHQLVRHRLFSFSQQSFRHTAPTDFVIPGTIKNNKSALALTEGMLEDLKKMYERLLEMGIPKEDARYIMPQGSTSNIVFTANARELRHFFKLRLDKHAQAEIRELAERMLDLVKPIAPTIFGVE